MPAWMDSAKCNEKEMPLDFFFEGYLKSRHVYDVVNATCKECPVQAACLNYGKITKSTGVWGGKWLQNGVVVKTVTKATLEEITL